MMRQYLLSMMVIVGFACGSAQGQVQTKTVHDEPAAVNVLLSDEVLAYQPAQSPSTRKLTLNQIQALGVLGVGGNSGITLSNNPLSVASNTPLEGVYATGGGSQIQMCPGFDFGCNTAINKITAQLANVTTSLADAGSLETGHYTYMVNKTGEALPWSTSKAYTTGQNIVAAGGTNLYVQTAASCISASSGTGPTGTGSGIGDGTCLWTYNGNPALRGKMAIAATTLVLPGGTDAWAGAFDTFIYNGWLDQFATGLEVDVTNNSGRDADGVNLTIPLLYLGGSVGTNPITSYISISPFGLNGTNMMAHEGIWSQGQYTIQGHDFRVSTHSLNAFFDDGNAVHGTSSYYDASTSPYSYIAAGTYSGAAINTTAATTTISLEAKDGQKICLKATDACFMHSGTKLYYVQGGVNLFSVADTTGNVIFKGTVTPSGTP